ncbi:hypothetical protein HCJ66_09255 [Listeria sp. FSL L7-1582]|nr:hypothetical protein [Listeria portnoyi]
MTSVETGLREVGSGKGFNAVTGVFNVSTLNMNWIDAIRGKWTAYATQDKKELALSDIGKEEIIKDYMNSYNVSKKTAGLIYQLQSGILERAEEENWDNEDVIYEFNRLVASCAQDNYNARRWNAICGTVGYDDLVDLCKQYGLSSKNAKILVQQINEQHLDSDARKDLAHEAVQMAAFTEKSWTWYPSISNGVHNTSHVANEGYEHEEISFKGDVDSGRYSDVDFNSDLDAINTYESMKNSNQQDIFKVQTQYNDGIQKNTTNRVEEFYQTYGSGNESAGKQQVKRIMEASTFGSRHIDGAYSDKEKQKHVDYFYDYLERGENMNVY